MDNNYKPTILQVLPSLNSGGVERGTVDIAKYLVSNGYKSVVASAGGKLSSELISNGSIAIALPVASKNPLQIYANIAKIKNVVKEHKIDIIHARSRAPAWSAYFAAKQSNISFVTSFHGTYNFSNILKQYYNSIMVKGEIVIAVSEFIKHHILQNYSVTEEKIRIIHRGVDTAVFNPALYSKHDKQIVKQLYNIPDVPVILLPGRFTEWKGQMFLIKALEKIKHLNFYCLLVGDQTKHPQFVRRLQDFLQNNNLTDKVVIYPPEYDMPKLYATVDIIVSASLQPEAFGRISIEAQAMEKLIIATKCGGACETIINGQTGLHVKVDDVDNLAEQLEYALTIIDSIEYKTVTQNARAAVVENFSLNKMQQKTVAVYKELL